MSSHRIPRHASNVTRVLDALAHAPRALTLGEVLAAVGGAITRSDLAALLRRQTRSQRLVQTTVPAVHPSGPRQVSAWSLPRRCEPGPTGGTSRQGGAVRPGADRPQCRIQPCDSCGTRAA